MNLTFTVEGAFGDSLALAAAMKISLNEELYMFEAFAGKAYETESIIFYLILNLVMQSVQYLLTQCCDAIILLIPH